MDGSRARARHYYYFSSNHLLLVRYGQAISAASYLFNFGSGYLVGLALGLTVSFSQIIVMLAFVYTITSLPISVGGHGVRELTLIAMFGLMGLSSSGQPEVAIAFSILLFSVQLIWSLIGGLYYLAHRQVEP